MWLVLGIGAIVSGLLNLYFYFRGKNPKLFRFASLSLTALTLWAFYYSVSSWVLSGDFAAIEDVVPTMSKALFILTLISIFINGFTLKTHKKIL